MSSRSVTVSPASSLRGTLQVPGDKSISHRAVIFASLAEGTTRISNLLEGEDVLCTIDCFRALGVPIEKKGSQWEVRGVGLKGLQAPSRILDCGNSGTTMRLLLGVLAAQPFESLLTGDASLNRRPMKRVTDPLTQMGARFRIEDEGTPHRRIYVKGGALQGIDYGSPVASAQVKSALLLTGLWAKGRTQVREPSLSRDHTERMMDAFGIPLQRKGTAVSVSPVEKLTLPSEFKVPGDFSSAAFFMVAGTLVPRSQITIEEVGLNPTRTGALEILKNMGASIEVGDLGRMGGEEMGSLVVSSAPLVAARVEGEIIPRLIDEIPILAVAAARAQGRTVIRDAAELRVKESDRIRVLADLLSRMGIPVLERPDGLEVEGGHPFHSADLESFGDHRMAMSMAVAALVAEDPLRIRDVDCVNTSFPSFWGLLSQLGASVRSE
jgi:3-phosphoshikimate 1-carboxyvinyltransferase